MERRTRIWVGLGSAVLVGGAVVGHAVTAAGFVPAPQDRPAPPAIAGGPERLFTAQDESGEGGAGEGGGQILGTITEFRLGSTDAAAFAYDASAQVVAYADLVYATYAEAEAAAEALRSAVTALLDSPSDATLAAARQAWIAARPAYLRTEAFQFYAGPVDGVGGPLPRLNAWPVDPSFLDGILADPSIPLGFRQLARMNQAGGPDQVTTGFHAIEYLLWGEAGDRPAADFLPGDVTADRRRALLAGMVQLLVNDLGSLTAAWAPDANNYRASVLLMDQRNALGRAFNGMTVLVSYEIPLRRIGAGLFPANAGFQQSPFSDTSAEDNLFAFDGARRVYFESGLDQLLAAQDPEGAAELAAAWGTAEAALAALDAPYDRFLAPPAGSAERATAEAAVRALTELGRDLRRAGNRLGVLVIVPGL